MTPVGLTRFILDAPWASNGRRPHATALPPQPSRSPGAVAALLQSVERAAHGTTALQTGMGSREPTPVELCRRPGCERPATTTGECLAHRVQLEGDRDPEWDREEL